MKINCIEHQILSPPSLFWPSFHSGSPFLAPAKNSRFLQFFLIIITLSMKGWH